MSSEVPLNGNEFDQWMSPDSVGAAPVQPAPPPVGAKDPSEAPAKKAGKPKKAATGGRKKPPLAIALPVVAGLLLVGGVAWTLTSSESDAPVSPEVEAVMARGSEIQIGGSSEDPAMSMPIAPVDTPLIAAQAAEADAVAQLAQDLPQSAAVEALESPIVVPVAPPVPAPTPVEVPIAAVVEAAVSPPAIKPVTRPSPIADEKAESGLKLRVEALEGDLYRTQRRLKAAQAEASALKKKLAAAPAAGHTLSAVLSDGAVVRDSNGREYVVKVGSEVRQ